MAGLGLLSLLEASLEDREELDGLLHIQLRSREQCALRQLLLQPRRGTADRIEERGTILLQAAKEAGEKAASLLAGDSHTRGVALRGQFIISRNVFAEQLLEFCSADFLGGSSPNMWLCR